MRIVARGRTQKPDHFAEVGAVTDAQQALKGTRTAFWGESWIDTPVYDGRVLGSGAEVRGPAMIEEPFTVVVLPPDAMARLDDMGNYVVTPQ